MSKHVVRLVRFTTAFNSNTSPDSVYLAEMKVDSFNHVVFTLHDHPSSHGLIKIHEIIPGLALQAPKRRGLLDPFKGCGMGPWLVLVSSCFRENVVATRKIWSFLCSLDNHLQKNIIVLFFGNQISKWYSFGKRAVFDLPLTFFSHQGKVTKIPSAHMSLTYIHIFCSPYWLFLPYQFWKNYEFIRYGFSLVWVLVLILIPTIFEQSINNQMVSKI